jgi:hypothetical protein
VAQWFHERGDEVTIAANHVAEPLSPLAPVGAPVLDAFDDMSICDFDFVWCQHDVLTLVPVAQFRRAVREGRVPFVVYASLSPYEPFEHVDLAMKEALSAAVVVNSPETRQAVLEKGYGVLSPEEIAIFFNAAPDRFWVRKDADRQSSSPELRNVLVVSNHPPESLVDAAHRLEARGVSVRFMGASGEYDLVKPEAILNADAVVTIGKTVVYGIACNRPVYIYDHFGGDGWLTQENFAVNLDHNFSGRPTRRLLDAQGVVDEIIGGFHKAASDMNHLGKVFDLGVFRLDRHLAQLRSRAEDAGARQKRVHRLAAALESGAFLANLESSHARHLVMRRSYRHECQLKRDVALRDARLHAVQQEVAVRDVRLQALRQGITRNALRDSLSSRIASLENRLAGQAQSFKRSRIQELWFLRAQGCWASEQDELMALLLEGEREHTIFLDVKDQIWCKTKENETRFAEISRIRDSLEKLHAWPFLSLLLRSVRSGARKLARLTSSAGGRK